MDLKYMPGWGERRRVKLINIQSKVKQKKTSYSTCCEIVAKKLLGKNISTR